MAHNSQRVPWRLFRKGRIVTAAADGLLAPSSPSEHSSSPALSHRKSAYQQRQLDTAALIGALCDALQHDIQQEAARHPRAPEPPADADLVIPDPAARAIVPLVRAWRDDIFTIPGYEGVLDFDDDEYRAWRLRFDAPAVAAAVENEDIPETAELAGPPIPGRPEVMSGRPCVHDVGFRCECLLPRSERTAAALRRVYPGTNNNAWYTPLEMYAKEYFGALVVRSLLVAGEMRPFFNMGRGETGVYTWEHVAQCRGGVDSCSVGWGCLQIGCLMSYIYLNALLALSGAGGAGGPSLLSSTRYRCRAVTVALLHRIDASDWLGNGLHSEFHRAELPPQDSLWELIPGTSLRLSPAAEAAAREALAARGLPEEIVLQILHTRMPRSPIRVRGDPLHPDNREAVGEYLELCWDVVVRCGVLQSWNPAAGDDRRQPSWAAHVGLMVRELQVKLWKEVEVGKCEAAYQGW